MPNEFIAAISSALERNGYVVEPDPRIPGVQALLYARFPRRIRLGFAKVEDHFLFVDWGNAAFGRLDRLLEIYKHFSVFANQGFRTPHALRMQIPNLAIAAVSDTPFPEEVIRFARRKNLNPWYGGEIGQVILVDTGNHQVVYQVKVTSSRYPRPGDFPLSRAEEVIESACRQAFSTGR